MVSHVVICHHLFILAILVGGLLCGYPAPGLRFFREGGRGFQLAVIAVKVDVDLSQFPHEKQNVLMHVAELFSDFLSLIFARSWFIIMKEQRHSSEVVAEFVVMILPNWCDHTHPGIATPVLKVEREVSRLNVDVICHHENRLEADAFLPNIVPCPFLGAFPYTTYRYEVLWSEAVFVAFHDNPIRIDVERYGRGFFMLFSFVVPVVIAVLK